MSSLSSKKTKKNIELQPQESLIEVQETNKVILIFFVLAFTLVCLSVSTIGLVLVNWKLANKEKIYVSQKGQMEIAKEQDPNYRDDKMIQETVINWMYLTWEWNSFIPNTPQHDPGIKIKTPDGMARVPTRSYTGSYLIMPGFRQSFLADFSKIVPENFYQGDLNSNLIIHDISDAQRINQELYVVKVIASRIDSESGYEKEQTYINRTFYLRPIMPYRLILEEQEPSAFKKQLKELLENGLMITKITP
jgi:hypothetical protein